MMPANTGCELGTENMCGTPAPSTAPGWPASPSKCGSNGWRPSEYVGGRWRARWLRGCGTQRIPRRTQRAQGKCLSHLTCSKRDGRVRVQSFNGGGRRGTNRLISELACVAAHLGLATSDTRRSQVEPPLCVQRGHLRRGAVVRRNQHHQELVAAGPGARKGPGLMRRSL